MNPLVDHTFALGAGDIRVRLEVDVDEFDLVPVIGQHLGRDQRATMAALAGACEISRARQENRELEHLRLRANNGWRADQRHGGGARE
jgi:hypothetical protein